MTELYGRYFFEPLARVLINHGFFVRCGARAIFAEKNDVLVNGERILECGFPVKIERDENFL
ncbi:MAG: hypothetical protein L6V86_01935 [Treponema sp.]|nr:MAG: hypothetical protein L6V86_01935 [Treponema sp.]